ncbi:MAG: ribulokinase [Verrucomicrobiaceae bacterium]|nr:MAG: ribulokinase [Verrucomicrobiaceae bacterium]
MKLSLGLDFGTESVRALLVDLKGGEHGVGVSRYRHRQITGMLPGGSIQLPPEHAFQHPGDWMESACIATRQALRAAKTGASSVIGVGVDFTSCTMLPTFADGTPLCLTPRFSARPQAWPKLWKHHGAATQAERMTDVAHQRGEEFLNRYGGTIGLEWLFPKILETLETDPEVYEAADLWLEAGDWFVWQLVGGDPADLPRSTCQAGYKGLWSARDGYPSADYLAAVHPGLANVVESKLRGRLVPPGVAAGSLEGALVPRLGLAKGTPVSAAIIDAHAGVPGAGADAPGTLVMVMGTSSCHMLNSEYSRDIRGVAGIVQDGILPGYFGYETGQAAVGDALDWLRRVAGRRDFKKLGDEAKSIPVGSDGVLCMDWFNGCRTPLMNPHVKGSFSGLALHHGSGHLYRALMEGSACGLRWIVETLRDGGVPVNRFIATGGLPHHNPLIVQIYSDMLGEPVTVHPSKQGPALGSAILGALASGAFSDSSSAIHAMSAVPAGSGPICKPDLKSRSGNDRLYQNYRALGAQLSNRSIH